MRLPPGPAICRPASQWTDRPVRAQLSAQTRNFASHIGARVPPKRHLSSNFAQTPALHRAVGLRALPRLCHLAKLATAREPALILAGGSIVVTMLEAFIVHATFANAVRNRDRREISGRREGKSEQDQQQCRNRGLMHPIFS